MAARIPFVAAIIAMLGCGLALTLLLTTRAAEDSYQLGDARQLNRTLAEERAALQRDVEAADSAPELAARARELGMIPAKDPARLVIGADGKKSRAGRSLGAETVTDPEHHLFGGILVFGVHCDDAFGWAPTPAAAVGWFASTADWCHVYIRLTADQVRQTGSAAAPRRSSHSLPRSCRKAPWAPPTRRAQWASSRTAARGRPASPSATWCWSETRPARWTPPRGWAPRCCSATCAC
jgi:hypothetical protein